LAVPAFRRLWASQLISEVGDWSARLVLSVLVYARTGSAAMTGLVTTASLVPWLGPGQLLTSLSERWPRRRVMVVADLARAAAFTVAVAPLPVPVLLGVVFCAGLATPPFEAARSALRPEIIPAPLFPAAVALSSITQDLTLTVGYASAGVLIALLGEREALLVNAVSFAVSAVLLAGLPRSAAPRKDAAGVAPLLQGWQALRREPVIVRAVLLVTASMLAASSLVAVAAPLALRVLTAGPALVGVLVALAGVVSIGATAAVPTQDDPALLLRWAARYATGGGAIMAGCFAVLSLGVPSAEMRTGLVVLAFVAAGLLFAVIAPANVVVSPLLPSGIRASALSLLIGALVATEAAGAAAAGAAASGVGILPVCAVLGVPPLVVGARALLAPTATGVAHA